MKQRKNFSYAKYGYIFCIPFILAFLIFSFYPLYYTVSISISDRQGVPLPGREYGIQTRALFDEEKIPVYDDNGNPLYDEDGARVYDITRTPILDEDGNQIIKIAPLENFRTVLNTEMFKRAFATTFRLWIVNFIPQILLAIILAAWFTSRWTKIKGQGVFKVLFYMPNIITAGTIAVLFSTLFLFPTGVVNDALIRWGILETPKNFRVDANATRLIVSFIQFWMWYGYTMLILISGILGLNPQMYESADIDGAGAVKQFFFITLPNLRTILIFTFVTSLIGGLNMFDIPMLYAGGGPGGATRTTSMFIYNQAFAGAYRYNTASAASVLMFLIIAALSAVIFVIMRDKDEARLKKLKKAEARAIKQAAKAVN
ncbi:MAG: sugar ABC transporter permease [Oscillospiraceae bacterium]|nr:sugar ABC transporter permease [Oscillospiraceae bacterium]